MIVGERLGALLGKLVTGEALGTSAVGKPEGKVVVGIVDGDFDGLKLGTFVGIIVG